MLNNSAPFVLHAKKFPNPNPWGPGCCNPVYRKVIVVLLVFRSIGNHHLLLVEGIHHWLD